MKAIVYRKFGSVRNLKLQEVPLPVPAEDEVLVKVHAASVNSWDWDLVTGKPLIYRPFFGIFKPKFPVVGSDIAGTVEAVGSRVRQFKRGDAVFGDISATGFGAFAEYACTKEKFLTIKPDKISFEEAASLPQAGVLALQGLKLGGLAKDKSILINGAGGGVGTLGIQLAKLAGARVTAVDSTGKLPLLTALGADEVIDYKKIDYKKSGNQYDLILDNVTQGGLKNFKQVLKPNGTLIVVGGQASTLLQTIILGNRKTGNGMARHMILIHKPNSNDLQTLASLVVEEKILPVIDKVCSFEEVPEAVQYLGEGRVKGKVVIQIAGNNTLL